MSKLRFNGFYRLKLLNRIIKISGVHKFTVYLYNFFKTIFRYCASKTDVFILFSHLQLFPVQHKSSKISLSFVYRSSADCVYFYTVNDLAVNTKHNANIPLQERSQTWRYNNTRERCSREGCERHLSQPEFDEKRTCS